MSGPGGLLVVGPFRVGWRSEPGRVRAENQDAILCPEALEEVPPTGLLVAVADGMGGHSAGALASAVVVEELARFAVARPQSDPAGALESCVQRAHGRLRGIAVERQLPKGMGSTLTAALLTPDRVHIVHVGDSRAMLVREGSLATLTEDHTVRARWERQGSLRPGTPPGLGKGVLTRAVGQGDALEVDHIEHDLHAGDLMILCSDGLHGVIDGAQLLECVGTGRSPWEIARALVGRANEAGSPDNVSVVVMDVGVPRRTGRNPSLPPAG